MNEFVAALPLIIAALVPPALAWFRAHVAALVPSRFIPLLLPIVGGLVSGIAYLVGFDVGDFDPTLADTTAWEAVIIGILTGLSSNGIHQIGRQLRKP